MDTELINQYMKEALNLAKSVKGMTSPNPAVGAVIIKDNEIIGKGATQRAGEDHAEIQAIKDALKTNTSLEECTMVVTLEPCSIHGKTPPCADRIIKEGFKEVYAAMLDPNKRINGKGIEKLRNAGIVAEYGFMEKEAERINEDFFKWIETGIPFVTVKYAMTLDGRMATSTHSSKWITCEEARKDSHLIRYHSDAVMVGSNTVKYDNPTLNSRIEGKRKYPLRIILDSIGQLDESHTVINDDEPTMVVTPYSENLISYYEKLLKGRKNKATLPIQMKNNLIDINELLKHLGLFQITSVMVEGGSRALYSFFKYKAIDKIVTYIAPKILTGSDSLVPFTGEIGPKDMSKALKLSEVTYKQVGTDIKVTGYLK